MRITKGKVIGGHVIVEGEPLDEGSIGTALISDERSFTLGDDDDAALLNALADAARGALVPGDDVIRNIS